MVFFGGNGCWTNFLYQSCPLCPFESRKTNMSQKKTLLKYTFQFGNFWDWNIHCSVNCLIQRNLLIKFCEMVIKYWMQLTVPILQNICWHKCNLLLLRFHFMKRKAIDPNYRYVLFIYQCTLDHRLSLVVLLCIFSISQLF